MGAAIVNIVDWIAGGGFRGGVQLTDKGGATVGKVVTVNSVMVKSVTVNSVTFKVYLSVVAEIDRFAMCACR
jgi:hypothetical protein